MASKAQIPQPTNTLGQCSGGALVIGGPESARKHSHWAALAGKIVIVVVVFSACLEGGSRLIFAINPLRRRATGFDDASYRLQWIRLRREQRDWTGPFATYHPTRGWALKPNIQDLHVFDGTVLNTNSRGLRQKHESNYQRTPGKHRIIALGDSFTFGAEVADDDTYSHYLESNLPNTEVLNFGVQGYGHDQALLYLKEEGVKYHPDVVILGFTYIDVYRNIESFFAYAKPKFELVSGSLQLTNVPVPTPDQVLAEETYRPKSLDMLYILHQKLRWTLGSNEAEARKITGLLLSEIASVTRSIGALPVFVYLPVNEEIEPFPQFGITTNSPPVEDREQYLRSLCERENVPCLFLGPRFREKVRQGADFHARGHWNAQAHALAGEEIKTFLLKNGLIQDNPSLAENFREAQAMN